MTVDTSDDNKLDLGSRSAHETALVSSDGAVWIALSPAWYDLASWVWWFFSPGDRRAFVVLHTESGAKVRTRAIRIARKHIKLRGKL